MQDNQLNQTLFFRHLAPTSPEPLALNIVKAKGIYLYDDNGKSYLDMISGISVSNLGHNHSEINKAVIEQVNKHSHLMVYGEFIQSAQIDYASELIKYLKKPFESVYFVNSGAEAVEGAMKLAKRVTGRHEIISCYNAYHGSSQGALSIMGSEIYKNKFRPLLPGCKLISFNSFDDLNKISDKTACVIIEPVQAEAGVILPKENYLQDLRKRCDKTGTLLIFDEIQTGFGRTGTLFAFQKYGVIPDVILLAKALGGGYPLGAFVSSHEIMNTLSHDPVLGHITTFGGHPVSCAAGYASLKSICKTDIIDNVQRKADIFKQKLTDLPYVKEFRQSALLMALEFENEKKCSMAINNCIDNGLISDWFLFSPQSMRLAPPLIISDEEIMKACEIIKKSILLIK